VTKRLSADGILASAATAFARRGYGETSLRDLMAAAKVSTTAFYARFSSKEEVLDALVERLLADLQEAASATIAAGGDIEGAFERGVGALTEVLLRQRVIVRLALTEAASSAKSRATLAKAYSGLANLLGARLAHLAKSDAADGEARGWALVGALAMQVQRWAVFEDLDDRGLQRALSSTARALLPPQRAKRKR